MAEFEPFSRLNEMRRRMAQLAERLEISPDQSDEKVWAWIGMVLAQKQKEFRGFAIFDAEHPEGPGRRKNTVNRDVLRSDKVEKHLKANPGLATIKAAVLDLRNDGVFPRGPKLETLLRSVERGNRVKRQYEERVQRLLEAADERILLEQAEKPTSTKAGQSERRRRPAEK